jgi:glyoxylase-like metal-dependent hydrolase (beta-lactamase superfamily II)
MKVIRFGFSLFGINTYIVWDESTRKCAVIDPGMINSTEREALTRCIKRKNLIVEHLINTHLHIDHAVGDKFVAATYGVPVSAHRADEQLGANMQMQADMFCIYEHVDNVTIGHYLEDGELISVGESKLKVIHLPGHSKGGIALYDEEGGYLLSGDTIFCGSVGRADLPGGDMIELINSIKTKLLTLPDDTVIYPGHGPETTIGAERKQNPYIN